MHPKCECSVLDVYLASSQVTGEAAFCSQSDSFHYLYGWYRVNQHFNSVLADNILIFTESLEVLC